MKTRVSAVIPCYNAAPFLKQTIESALSQTHAPCEVLVIDDGSTDQSAAIARSYGPSVRVIPQKNMGESVARNRGIDEAQGDWIAFLDADDVWLPEKLERQLAAIRPGVVCVHTSYRTFGTYCHTRDFSAIPPPRRYCLESFFLGRSPLGPSTLLVPKWLTARFPEWTRFAEDTIYFVEVSRLGQMTLVPDPLVAVRIHAGSQSAERGILARWHATFEQWLQQNADTLDSVQVDQLREKMLARLVHLTYRAYYRRDMDEYQSLNQYLARYSLHAEVRPLFHTAIPPRWLYTLRRRWKRFWAVESHFASAQAVPGNCCGRTDAPSGSHAGDSFRKTVSQSRSDSGSSERAGRLDARG